MAKIILFVISYIAITIPAFSQTIISGGTITENTTWDLNGSPYIIQGNVIVDETNTLTIEEDVEVRFNSGLNLTVYGILSADGVTFQSNEAEERGAWGTIRSSEQNMNQGEITILNSIIRHADRAIYAEAGTVTLTGTQILNSTTGVEIGAGAAEVTLENVSLSGNEWPVRDASLQALITTGDFTVSGNTFNGILVHTNSVSGTAHELIASPVPYVFHNTFTVNEGASLTVASDNILKFAQNIRLNVDGTFIADGTGGNNPIHITSLRNDNMGGNTNNDGSVNPSSGDWDGIFFRETATEDGLLDHVEISYAGRSGWGGLNISSPLTVSNSLIRDSGTGIVVNTGADASVSGTTIRDTETRGIYATGGDISLTGSGIEDVETGLELGGDAGTVALENVTFSGHVWPIVDASLRALQTSGEQEFLNNDFQGVKVNTSSVSGDDHRMAFVPVPYVFDSNFTVNEGAQLTIDPENILKINFNRTFTVHGGLIADGSSGTEPIYFTSLRNDNIGGDTNNDGTSTAPDTRDWSGIVFTSTATSAGLLDHVEISYAGRGNRGAVTITDASPTIQNSTFLHSYIGIQLHGTAEPVISGSTFGTSELYPLAMELTADPVLSGNILSFQNNEYDAIGIIGGTLSTDAAIVKRNFTDIPNITYVMLGNIEVPEGITLTMEAGVVIKVWNSRFVVKGTLLANGTEEENIVMTSVRDDNVGNPNDTNKDGNSTVPALGNWNGIIFDTGSDDSVLDYVDIRYARTNNYNFGGTVGSFNASSAIVIADSDITLQNSEIREANIGITVLRDGKPTIANNAILNTQSTPLALSLSADPVLTGNEIENSGLRAIGLVSETVSRDGVVRRLNFGGFENITYALLGSVTIASGTTVEVEPGVVIKGDTRNDIYVEGAFSAVGDETNGPVIFTSINDDNFGNPHDTNRDGGATSPDGFDWGSIVFRSTADEVNSVLDNVEIWYSTHGVVMRNASVPVKNSLISNPEYWGIALEGGSSPEIDDVTIQNTGEDPIVMSVFADPVLNGITFNSNSTDGLAILEGQSISTTTSFGNRVNHGGRYFSGSSTVSSDATLSIRSFAGYENVPYVIRHRMEVGENTRLTIHPGVIIKGEGNGEIHVHGALIADATPEQRIIFTSLRDDSAGGDTNNDGNATVPGRSNWSGIQFHTSSIDNENLLRNVTIRYLNGRFGNDRPIHFDNAGGLIDETIIEQTGRTAISIRGNASPVIQNTQFLNISGAPVELDMFSDPVFEGNTVANVDYVALQVRGETWTSSGTIPVRDFAGYENITYLLAGHITVGTGTTITIPAGLVFKSDSRAGSATISYEFRVDGALIVAGEDGNPVIFTHLSDDEYGNPGDTESDGFQEIASNNLMRNSWIVFNSGSDDENSIIDHAIFRYKGNQTNAGVITLNGASPVIQNSRFELSDFGIILNQVSEPVVVNNVFEDLNFTPLRFSLVSYPSETSGNQLTGRTYRALGVNSETLVQDVTLPRRDFAGIEGMPYYVTGNYTVGSGAVLTVDPGVIMKFASNANLDVERGLIAEGTEEAKIVFTSIADDFYGGDTNQDSTATDPASNSNQWNGITFESTSLAALSKLDHVVVRYAGRGQSNGAGIRTQGASPTITNSVIQRNSNGIIAEGSSNPVINDNDIYENLNDGVRNVSGAFNIDATNNWWGSNMGPAHEGNPDGTGDAVSDNIAYLPFVGDGSVNPQLGDVALNGKIQAYDAALILRHIVDMETLSDVQLKAADVSGDGSVSALDASYILQYAVRLLDVFPADVRAKGLAPEALAEVSDIQFETGQPEQTGEDEFYMDLYFENVQNLLAFSLELGKSGDVRLTGYEAGDLAGGKTLLAHENGEVIRIAMAGTEKIHRDGDVIRLKFEGDPSGLSLSLNSFIANEKEMTHEVTSAEDLLQVPDDFALHQNYPNPFNPGTNIRFDLPESSDVRIEVFNLLGQRVAVLEDGRFDAGVHTVHFDAGSLSSGVYIYRIRAGSYVKSHRMTLVK